MLPVGNTPNPASPAPGLERVAALFTDRFGAAPAVVASAPGRVNLIGEHLDYNGGPVLPFAIQRRTWVAAGAAPEFTMTTSAARHDTVRRGLGPREGNWSDYVMGVVQELGSVPCALEGARLAVVSDIPPGAGLSSSAALSVAAAAALGALAGCRLSAEVLAEVAFRGEHDYVGVRCGRMDQTVVAHASEGTAIFFDTATDRRTMVPFPLTTWIVGTGVYHALGDGVYNARRAECEEALTRCRRRWPDLAALAAIDHTHLEEALAMLPSPLDRRVRHVVTETTRTRQVRQALTTGDLKMVGRELVAGHESLRDDFESTIVEADFLVDAAVREGALGARLTGAGWGGSVVVLVAEQGGSEAIERMGAAFAGRFGRSPAAWPTRAGGGVQVDIAA